MTLNQITFASPVELSLQAPFHQTTEEIFKKFVGDSFHPNEADSIDTFIHDVLLAAQEGSLATFQERIALADIAPSLQTQLLVAAQSIATGDKLAFIQKQLKNNAKATIEHALDQISATELGFLSAALAQYDRKRLFARFWDPMKAITLTLLATGAALSIYKTLCRTVTKSNHISLQFEQMCPAIDLDTLTLKDVVDICQEPSLGPTYCAGNRGVPRIQMPQVAQDVLQHYIQSLQTANGTAVEQIEIDTRQIVPYQSEQRMGKILDMVKSTLSGIGDICSREIIVAGLDDGSGTLTLTIVDGHHGGTACKILGGIQRVIWIKADPTKVIDDLNAFPGVWHSSL